MYIQKQLLIKEYLIPKERLEGSIKAAQPQEYVCIVSSFSRVRINLVWSSCSWSAEQGKIFFPCLHPCVRIWSRETGLAVPSRVSLLILHTQTAYDDARR